jgi:hypothetical protein
LEFYNGSIEENLPNVRIYLFLVDFMVELLICYPKGKINSRGRSWMKMRRTLGGQY